MIAAGGDGAVTGHDVAAIGPMIGSTVNLGQSVSTSFPSITIVPTGMISGTTIYAQTQSPRDFSG